MQNQFLFQGFVLPLLMSLIPFFTDQYGGSGYWCWIKIEDGVDIKGLLMGLAQFYGVLWVLFVYIIWTNVEIKRYMEQLPEKSKRILDMLKWYPRIIIICFSWATLNRIANFLTDESWFGLQLMHVMFSGLFGFLNALAYGMNGTIRRILVAKLREKGILS